MVMAGDMGKPSPDGRRVRDTFIVPNQATIVALLCQARKSVQIWRNDEVIENRVDVTALRLRRGDRLRLASCR